MRFLCFFNGNFLCADVNAVQSENTILILKIAQFVLLLLITCSALLEHFPSAHFVLHYHFTGRETEAETNTASCPGKQCHMKYDLRLKCSAVTCPESTASLWPVGKL